MSKLQFHSNKILKLTNVLKCKLDLLDQEIDFPTQILKMESFIKSKGAAQVGPLIQYVSSYVNSDEEVDMEVIFMMQCNTIIHKLEPPYTMEPVI